MAAHKGPASLRPRFTRSGSSVAAMPIYLSKWSEVSLPASYKVENTVYKIHLLKNNIKCLQNSYV
jgi:hypothetical protein